MAELRQLRVEGGENVGFPYIRITGEGASLKTVHSARDIPEADTARLFEHLASLRPTGAERAVPLLAADDQSVRGSSKLNLYPRRAKVKAPSEQIGLREGAERVDGPDLLDSRAGSPCQGLGGEDQRQRLAAADRHVEAVAREQEVEPPARSPRSRRSPRGGSSRSFAFTRRYGPFLGWSPNSCGT